MTKSSEILSALLAQAPLAMAWAIYASIHSLTASERCKAYVKWRWPRFLAGYRLFYNVLASLLLLPVAVLAWRQPGPALWAFEGLAAWLVNGLALTALLAFVRFGGGYDLRAFLGLRAGEPTPSRLVIGAWHRYVRHPWYSLGLVLMWTRDMHAATLTSAIAITIYLIIGSRLEEAKLIAEFGERYAQYRRRVPGLIPRPWRVLSKEEARRLAG